MKVLGIFAHPDDEIACIGTLANHSDRGDKIHLLFLTKGEGTSKLKGTADEIKQQRMTQVSQAALLINATTHFLDIEDTRVMPNREQAELIAQQIKLIQPDIIITWNHAVRTGTGHPDHRYTHSLVIDAITYARFGSQDEEPTPYRDKISVYTIQHHEENPLDLVFVDVTHQIEIIEQYIANYKITFGDWDAIAHKKSIIRYYGEYIRAEYAEAFKKLTWKAGRLYLD